MDHGRRCRRPVVLVNLERVDEPVRILESAWVVLHKGIARTAMCSRAASTPRTTRPSAAECIIEDDLVVGKVVVEVATGEMALRFAPTLRVRRRPRYIAWSSAFWPEPYRDGVASPLHRIDATAVTIEAGAVAG